MHVSSTTQLYPLWGKHPQLQPNSYLGIIQVLIDQNLGKRKCEACKGHFSSTIFAGLKNRESRSSYLQIFPKINFLLKQEAHLATSMRQVAFTNDSPASTVIANSILSLWMIGGSLRISKRCIIDGGRLSLSRNDSKGIMHVLNNSTMCTYCSIIIPLC